MATIIRVKRRIDEEPMESITVSAKRVRVDVGGGAAVQFPETEESCKTLLNRLTTLKDKEEVFSAHVTHAIQKDRKSMLDLKQNYRKPPPNDYRKSVKLYLNKQAKINRYKLVSSQRILSTAVQSEDEIEYKIFDAIEEDSNVMSQVEDVITCNGLSMKSEKVDFVYDIFYTSKCSPSDWTEDFYEIERNDELVFENDELSDAEAEVDEEDDENCEDNWRTDYPEEDDLFDGDDELHDRFKNSALCDSDWSHDSEDD